MNRILSALLVPLVVILCTAALVVGIGELLLFLAGIMPELGGVHEPLAIAAALLMAGAILGIAALISRLGGTPPQKG